MEKDAARTGPPAFVPESGEYDTPFDAKAGIRRLMSYPNRTREDVLSVIIACVESRTASQSIEVASMAYGLIGMLGSPQDDIETRLFAKAISIFPEPQDLLVNKIASGDPTGTLAALFLMSQKTPDSAISAITLRWGVISMPMGYALNSRNMLVNKMIELSSSDIASWENENSSAYFAVILKNEGWFSPFAKKLINGMKTLPALLVEMIISSAPESVSKDIARREAISTKNMINIVLALQQITDPDESKKAVERFMSDESVRPSEKVKLYEYFIGGHSIDDASELRMFGMKAFAAIPNQTTFDVALGKLLDGSDMVSIRELTGNIDFSVIDYKPIANKLERMGLMQNADPRFVAFVRAIEAQETDAGEGLDDFLDGDFGKFGLSSAGGNVRMGGMNFGKNTALLFAAILIAVGMPVSIVLSRTGTTGSELASRPDIAQKGRQIAMKSQTSGEYARMVEKALAMVNETPQPAPEMEVEKPIPKQPSHAKPTSQQRMQAMDVSRQLVDAIVMLEHVPGKDFSSVGAGGLMQLMPATWDEINRKQFGGKYPFKAYVRNDWVNRKFGTIYLNQIKNYLDDHKSQWKTDQLPLMFACYFGGIGNVKKANFDPRKIKRYYPKTYDYMVRGSNLMGYDTAKL